MNDLSLSPTEPIAARRQGVAAVVERRERLLVIRRSLQVVAPGAYCFPGGHVEAGESQEEALRRELREELGVDIRPRQRIWESVTPWGVALAWWSCELAESATPIPHPGEVASYHWFTVDELTSLPELLESNQHFLAACRRGEIYLRACHDSS